MIERLGRRLRLVVRRTDETSDVVAVPVAPAGRDVEFVAYGEDCLLSGRLRISTDRLTDMLNNHDGYRVVDALVERLEDRTALEIRDVLIARDDLLLVQATGPRGNLERRRRTRPHAVAVQLGPYHVRGYVHAAPGVDPLATIRRRRPMVPLTDAWIEYAVEDLPERRRLGTVLINREQMDWIAPALDEEVEFAELPEFPVTHEAGPLLKDFTGALFDRT